MNPSGRSSSSPDAAAVPVELRVTAGGASLSIAWSDGVASRLAAGVLRAACRCADCTAARVKEAAPVAKPEIAITHMQAIGGYAVNLAFSDGHARGIYPWTMLRGIDAG